MWDEHAEQEAIRVAGVPTEAEMQTATVPTPNTLGELAAYIDTLVNRPHDYGTCVYAMSHAAVAAFNYVARQLGVTGFQAGCADLDILQHTRRWRWGRLLNYEDLLYPQYCTDEYFPGWQALLADPTIVKRLAQTAQEKLREVPDVHETVRVHWNTLITAAERNKQ